MEMRDKVRSIIRLHPHETKSEKVRLRREASEHDNKHVGSARSLNVHHHHHRRRQPPGGSMMNGGSGGIENSKWIGALLPPKRAFIAGLSIEDVAGIARRHPLPSLLCVSLLFFMAVEYTHGMVPSSAPPVDLGFVLTQSLHGLLATMPSLNSALAALNTVSPPSAFNTNAHEGVSKVALPRHRPWAERPSTTMADVRTATHPANQRTAPGLQ